MLVKHHEHFIDSDGKVADRVTLVEPCVACGQWPCVCPWPEPPAWVAWVNEKAGRFYNWLSHFGIKEKT